MTGKVTAIDYNSPTSATSCQGYTLEFNCYHVTINANVPRTGAAGPIIYKRGPSDESWLDETHSRICAAIKELDEAILNAVKKENQRERL